jgi:hypothetical protein
MSVCVVCGVLVANGLFDLAARATVLQSFLFDWATIGAGKKFTLQRLMNRARDACDVGCHSARFLLPFFGATGRDSSSHRTERLNAS